MTAGWRAAHLEAVRKNKGVEKKPNILRKLVFCADCGRAMTYKREVYDNGRRKICYNSYECPSHANDKESCPVKSIRRDALLEMLWELLEKQISLAGKLFMEASAIRSSERWKAESAALEKEYASAGKDLERLQTLYGSLYPMYAGEKILTEREYVQMKQDYRMRIGQAEKVLETIEEKKRKRAGQIEENPWLKVCMLYQDEKGVTEEMAHALISRIEVYTDKSISVSFRWQDEFQKLAETLETEGGAHHGQS